ncbi:uncharacterized protein NEMAJ01_1180 [Nematocida major]|uniref:uncharacterized protein n=1 Tax=Nematocida major TaxID=1912982 RepID=UPI0020076584|nr:uncharacterized protein NEMAJ01_1180 [Nematocida major]KAH9386284.1 hypothetical protein NEMAJ01_1180 [Nematocida major]
MPAAAVLCPSQSLCMLCGPASLGAHPGFSELLFAVWIGLGPLHLIYTLAPTTHAFRAWEIGGWPAPCSKESGRLCTPRAVRCISRICAAAGSQLFLLHAFQGAHGKALSGEFCTAACMPSLRSRNIN